MTEYILALWQGRRCEICQLSSAIHHMEFVLCLLLPSICLCAIQYSYNAVSAVFFVSSFLILPFTLCHFTDAIFFYLVIRFLLFLLCHLSKALSFLSFVFRFFPFPIDSHLFTIYLPSHIHYSLPRTRFTPPPHPPPFMPPLFPPDDYFSSLVEEKE